MSHFFRPLIVAAVGLLLLACADKNRQAADVLARAVAIVEQNPDSALLLLSAIEQPEDLPREQRMEYELRKVQAKDKAYQDITADTLVFEVAHYYAKGRKPAKAALALLYCGRVRHEQKKYEEAAKEYLRANDFAEKVTDVATKGLINHFLGEVHYHTCAMQKAIAYYKIANRSFHSLGKYHNVIGTFLSIGNCFLFEEEQDSALFYYNQGLQLAKAHQDVSRQSGIYQSMGLAFEQRKDFSSAAAHFQQAEKLGGKKEHQAMLYHSLAHAHYQQGQDDLSIAYAHKILSLHAADSTIGAHELANTHELLSFLSERRGDHEKALEHHRQYVSYFFLVLDERMTTSVLELQKKYDVEKIRNLHNKQIISYLLLSTSLLLLLLVAMFIALLFRRHYRRVQKQLQYNEQKMNGLIEQFQQLEVNEKGLREELEGKAKDGRAKEKALDTLIQQRLSSLREATLWKWALNADTRERLKEWLPKFNKVVYGQAKGSDWELFYEAVNEIYGGRLKRLSRYLPPLGEEELKICILLLADFEEQGVATVTGLNASSIRRRKSSIRQKLGIAEYSNILKALQGMLS